MSINVPKLPVAEVPVLSNAVSAAPNTAAQIAGAGVDKVVGFVGPLLGPALIAALAVAGIKTVAGKPPAIVKKIIG